MNPLKILHEAKDLVDFLSTFF